jgi:hypothetical protein
MKLLTNCPIHLTNTSRVAALPGSSNTPGTSCCGSHGGQGCPREAAQLLPEQKAIVSTLSRCDDDDYRHERVPLWRLAVDRVGPPSVLGTRERWEIPRPFNHHVSRDAFGPIAADSGTVGGQKSLL